MAVSPKPAVSVILVSDYAAGASKSWDDIRGTLVSLARQDYTDPVEFLLSESTEHAPTIPLDLTSLLPSLRIVLSASRGSYGLKNHGVAAATADIIAILDADCRPEPDG